MQSVDLSHASCGRAFMQPRAAAIVRRGAKCASAAHEGGAPLGFQPVHTPGQTRRSSRGVGDIPDTASSPRRHRYRGAHASQPLSQPPARYRPLDLNFSTLQCSTVLLYDLGIRYTVLTVYSTTCRSGYCRIYHARPTCIPPRSRSSAGRQAADKTDHCRVLILY